MATFRYTNTPLKDKARKEVNFSALLQKALNEPGKVKEVYGLNFWDYSFGNCFWAACECESRGIPLGPISTFKGWIGKKRCVKKGEKAISLCMPVTRKFKKEDKETGEEKEHSFQSFVFKPLWFVLSQTEGEEMPIHTTPDWDKEKALTKLQILEVPYSSFSGNSGGYAQTVEVIENSETKREHRIAISPLNDAPTGTLYHEIAHIVLGHTAEKFQALGKNTPRDIREVEAECVSMFCLEALGLPGAEYSRSYIQGWLKDKHEIPEKIVRRIFKATDSILRAGI
jgi:hypothetical protein